MLLIDIVAKGVRKRIKHIKSAKKKLSGNKVDIKENKFFGDKFWSCEKKQKTLHSPCTLG